MPLYSMSTLIAAFVINVLIGLSKMGFASKWTATQKQIAIFILALGYAIGFYLFTNNASIAAIVTKAGIVLASAIAAYEILWSKIFPSSTINASALTSSSSN